MTTDIAIKKAAYSASETETYSKNILGPVEFTLKNLRVEGLAGDEPKPPAPDQSPRIIASDEAFEASVDIEFNNTPLTQLLLCLGTRVTICFSFEGVGAKAIEVDLEESVVTQKGQRKLTLTWSGTPDEAGLTSGFYAIAAVATIGPVEHPCAPKCAYGFGYIAKALMQVYPAFDGSH